MAIISVLRTIVMETLEKDGYLSTVFPDPARHESQSSFQLNRSAVHITFSVKPQNRRFFRFKPAPYFLSL